MSTPLRPPKTPQASKTPGWLQNLFSTVKKPESVEDSTDSTGTSDSFNKHRTSLPLPSVEQSYNPSMSTKSPAAASLSPNRSSFPESPATYPHKSPWKSRSKLNGVTVAVGNPKAKAVTKQIVKKRRTKSYRHKASVILSRPRERKAVDPKSVSQVLQNSQHIFLPSSQQTQALANYSASFRPGKRMLGSNQSTSRLPPTTATDNALEEATNMSNDMPMAKKQKKVIFGGNEQLETTTDTQGFQTPMEKAMPLKNTPFRLRSSTPSPAAGSTLSTPASETKVEKTRLEPKPEIKYIVKQPYTDFGPCASIGEPIIGSINLVRDLGYASISKSELKNFSMTLPAETDDLPETSDDTDTPPPSSEADAVASNEPETKRSKVKENVYICPNCQFENDPKATGCKSCGEQFGWGNLFSKTFANKWKCKGCSSHNDNKFDKCQSCEMLRDGSAAADTGTSANTSTGGASVSGSIGAGGFTFGGSTTSAAPTSGAGFSFGTAAPAPASTGGFSFGTTTPAPAPSSETGGGFSFTGAASTAKSSGGFTFGAPPKTDDSAKKEEQTEKAPAPAAFTFGSSSQAEEKKVTGFSFGSAPVDSDGKESDSGPKQFSFSTSAEKKSEDIPKKPAFTFGATTVTETKAKDDTESSQKAAKRSRPVSNETTTSNETKPFTFASSKPAENGDKPAMPSFSFSTPAPALSASEPASTSKPTFSFSAPTPSKATPPAFGSIPSKKDDRSKRQRDDSGEPKPLLPLDGAAASTASTPGFSFGTTTTATAPTTTLASTSAPKENGGDTSNALSASTTDTAKGAFSFGNAPTPAATVPFKFGAGSSSADSTPAPAPATFSFGGAPAAAPAAPASTAPAPSFSFGSAPTPAPSAPSFGTSAPAPAPSAPTFGTSAPAPTPSAPTFGTSAPAPTPSAPTFGSSAPAPAPFTFNSSAPSTGAPSFGNTPAPSFGQAAPTPAPAFGSAPNPFGSSAPAPSNGFGSTPTPGQFGAPAPAPFGATPSPAPFGAQQFGGNTPVPAFGQSAGQQTPAFPTPAAPNGFSAQPQQQPFGGGGFGGGFGGTNTPAAPSMGGMSQGGGGGGFSVGTGGPKKAPGTRRRIRAKRPGRA